MHEANCVAAQDGGGSGSATLVRCYPAFLIIGAMRSGTGALLRALNRHPRLRSGRGEGGGREVHFFSSLRKDEELHDYVYRFPLLPEAEARGMQFFDKSPDYMRSKAALRQLHLVVPSAKLIVILRDPARRAISEFHHNCRHGRYVALAASRTILHKDDVVSSSSSYAPLPSPCSDEDVRAFYFSSNSTGARKEAAHGFYAQQLRWVLALFPPHRLLLLFQENMQLDLPGTLRRVGSFLDLAEPFSIPATAQAGGAGGAGGEKEEGRNAVLQELRRFYAPHVLQLRALLVEFPSLLGNASALPAWLR